MSSINDSLSPDLLFNIFKRLDCIETTRVRRVCKQWFEIIDEHKSFWRTLHLPKDSGEWDPSIVKLYDQKSCSTLQKVVIKIKVAAEVEDDLFETLEKSKGTLQHLYVIFTENIPEGPFSEIDALEVVETFPKLVHLTIIDFYADQDSRVRLRSFNSAHDSLTHQDSTSPLKVLWTPRSATEWRMKQSARFENLVSFNHHGWVSSPELRRFLEGPCKNLKHLGINVTNTEGDTSEKLEFPKLEVLKIDYDEEEFPNWLVFPTSVKLLSWVGWDLPSISELWMMNSRVEPGIGIRCPQLKTVRIFDWPEGEGKLDFLLKALIERSENVKAGFKVDGIRMENIKAVIFPYKTSNLESMEKLRTLVEEVIDGDTLPQFLEVEI